MKLAMMILSSVLMIPGCAETAPLQPASSSSYLDYRGRDDVLSGGVRMVPVQTPQGTFRVWTKRVGNNPRIKVLLLHGGPGLTHEYLEAFDSYFPAAEIEYYYYDQLGSAYSDQPGEAELWDLPRFVGEVEQVRTALGLDRENFYLYGHSWGGVLAIEYALKYPQQLKGLIISNMVSNTAAVNDYANSAILPAMGQPAQAQIESYEAAGDYDNPNYLELLDQHYFAEYFLRMPLGAWPEPVMRSLRHFNPAVSVPLLGRSQLFGGGKLAHWDRSANLKSIVVPTLVIGARHDMMNPEHMKWMADSIQNARYLYCANGSHMTMYDDQQRYFEGLIEFIRDVDAGVFD